MNSSTDKRIVMTLDAGGTNFRFCAIRGNKPITDILSMPSNGDDLEKCLANMVEGGKTPILPAAELQVLGFAVVIFPGGIVRALAKAAEEFYGSLKANGTTEPFCARMFDFTALNHVIGTPDMIAHGKRYEAPKSK